MEANYWGFAGALLVTLPVAIANVTDGNKQVISTGCFVEALNK